MREDAGLSESTPTDCLACLVTHNRPTLEPPQTTMEGVEVWVEITEQAWHSLPRSKVRELEAVKRRKDAAAAAAATGPSNTSTTGGGGSTAAIGVTGAPLRTADGTPVRGAINASAATTAASKVRKTAANMTPEELELHNKVRFVAGGGCGRLYLWRGGLVLKGCLRSITRRVAWISLSLSLRLATAGCGSPR